MNKQIMIIMTSLLVTACSTTSSLQVIISNQHCITNESISATAINALTAVYNKDNNIEWAGVIYRQGTGYCYSMPITGNDDSFEFETQLPIAGLYHTHPSGNGSEYFSQTDIDQANNLKVPSFIAVMDTNEIKEFTTGDYTFDYDEDTIAADGIVITTIDNK